MSKAPPRVLSSSVRILPSILVSLAVLFAAPEAQARELHWKALAVTAELDADGVLHVVERQDMVMTGDWNGGERIFTLRPGQDVVLHGMTRIDPLRGTRRAMVEGGLEDVDEYGWINGKTLRWRSRLPGDASFDGADLVYELDYSLYGVLEKRDDDTYVFAHEFVFTERSGAIDSFTGTLRIDPAWSVAGPSERTFRTGPLAPGVGQRVVLDLKRSPSAGTARLAISPERARLVLALAGVPLLLLVHLLASEWVRGRFAPLTPGLARQDGWLESNLLGHPAELIGAVWDRSVSADEVASLVARLTAEGALETRVDADGDMQLTLKADREAYGDYERALLDGFFFDGRTETSTGLVREHYRAKGFNPAALITPGLEARVREVVGPSARHWWLPLWLPTFLAYWGGLFLLWWGPGSADTRWPRLFVVGLPTLIVGGIGMGLAASWRDRIDRGIAAIWPFLIPMGLLIAVGWGVATNFAGMGLFATGNGLGPQGRLGVTLVVLALVNSIVNHARSRERSQGIALRKRLASARRYFDQELDRPQPALKDEWFPYVLAFGLDEEAQDWFRAHAAESTSSSRGWPISHSSGGSSGGSSSGSSGGSSGWSGGGGAFGGAGASSSWAAAAGGLSAGIAAPSSSGSSGGGGGGGSSGGSGGGGGGGW